MNPVSLLPVLHRSVESSGSGRMNPAALATGLQQQFASERTTPLIVAHKWVSKLLQNRYSFDPLNNFIFDHGMEEKPTYKAKRQETLIVYKKDDFRSQWSDASFSYDVSQLPDEQRAAVISLLGFFKATQDSASTMPIPSSYSSSKSYTSSGKMSPGISSSSSISYRYTVNVVDMYLANYDHNFHDFLKSQTNNALGCSISSLPNVDSSCPPS